MYCQYQYFTFTNILIRFIFSLTKMLRLVVHHCLRRRAHRPMTGCSIGLQYTAAAVRSVSWTDHRRESNRRAIAGVLVFARFHRDRYRAFPVDCVRLFPDMRVRPRIYTLMTTSTHRLARKLATN